MATQHTRPVIGIVAQDKAAGSRELLIHPHDTLIFQQGELQPIAQKTEVSRSGKNGTSVGEVTETNVVKAVYYGDANSDMPPDVVKGEEVEIFRDTDTNTYYWRSTGRTAKHRSRERKEVRSANAEGYDKNVDDGNSYFIRIDTLETKEIRIQTGTSDGEKYGYTILIKPSENKIRISDSENNEIGIDSGEQRVYLRNKENCIISIEKKNILVGAVEDIILKADRQVVLQTPLVSNKNENGSGCTVFDAKSMQFNAERGVVFKTPAIGLHGAVEAESVVAGGVQAENYCTGKY